MAQWELGASAPIRAQRELGLGSGNESDPTLLLTFTH